MAWNSSYPEIPRGPFRWWMTAGIITSRWNSAETLCEPPQPDTDPAETGPRVPAPDDAVADLRGWAGIVPSNNQVTGLIAPIAIEAERTSSLVCWV